MIRRGYSAIAEDSAGDSRLLVEIENVAFAHAGVPVLRDFNLQIAGGQHHLLLGPSGSGKSTLLNLICGFLSPDAGVISIAGEAISVPGEARRDAIRRRHIGVVFQTLRLVSALDLVANLQLAARLAGRPATRDDAMALLDRLGLKNKARSLPRMLSQGEAQRGAIARALIARPRLLVADEPTSALDDRNTQIIARLFRELAEAEGATLLIATHDARLREWVPNSVELAPTMELAAAC